MLFIANSDIKGAEILSPELLENLRSFGKFLQKNQQIFLRKSWNFPEKSSNVCVKIAKYLFKDRQMFV